MSGTKKEVNYSKQENEEQNRVDNRNDFCGFLVACGIGPIYIYDSELLTKAV